VVYLGKLGAVASTMHAYLSNKMNKQKGFAPILVLVIILILGGVGFVVMQSFQPKPLVTPTPNLSRDEDLRGWKTYTNAQFTFNYPSIWFISEEKDKVILYSYDYTKLGDFNPPIDVPEGLDIFQIHISTDNQYADIKSWFEKQKEKISPVTNKTYEFLSVKEVTIDEFQGIYYEGADEWGGGLYANTSFETPNKELVHFSTNLFYKGHEKTYNQILSTFRFLSDPAEASAEGDEFLESGKKVISQELPEGITSSCKSDADCDYVLSYNDCRLFCANDTEDNKSILQGLPKTCDAGYWDPPFALNCGCINNKCQLYE